MSALEASRSLSWEGDMKEGPLSVPDGSVSALWGRDPTKDPGLGGSALSNGMESLGWRSSTVLKTDLRSSDCSVGLGEANLGNPRNMGGCMEASEVRFESEETYAESRDLPWGPSMRIEGVFMGCLC